MTQLSVVVPVYNEVENLSELHQEITAVCGALQLDYELVLVDDGSTDGSREELAELVRRDAHVVVVELARNYGQTAAMQAGIEAARGATVVLMDGDLQNDPRDIPALLARLDEGYDLVHGWRTPRRDPFWTRQFPSRCANWLISRVTGFPIHDLGCSLKALRREAADELELCGQMHRFIPILAHARGARCSEIITHHRPRLRGKTKYGLGRTLQVILDLCTVRFLQRYVANPMRLFGWIGLWALGVATLSCTVGMLQVGGVVTLPVGATLSLLLGALSAFFGLQMFACGLLAEMNTRNFYQRTGRRPFQVRRVLESSADIVPMPSRVQPRAGQLNTLEHRMEQRRSYRA